MIAAWRHIWKYIVTRNLTSLFWTFEKINHGSNRRNALIVTFFSVSISLFILIMCNYSCSEMLLTLHISTAVRSMVKHSTEMNKLHKTRIKDTVYGEQFVTHGKYMPGKRHNQTCDFIPKRNVVKRIWIFTSSFTTIKWINSTLLQNWGRFWRIKKYC